MAAASKLSAMEVLVLEGLQLSPLPPGFFRLMTGLKTLYLNATGYLGTFPALGRKLTSVELLNLVCLLPPPTAVCCLPYWLTRLFGDPVQCSPFRRRGFRRGCCSCR